MTTSRAPVAVLARHRDFLLLMGAVFCVGGGFGVQIPLFANFIYERFGVRTHEYGYLEALRETPGFLTAFFATLTMVLAAPRLAMASLLIMGTGIASYAAIVPLAGVLGDSPILALIVTSVFWSIGFHSWTPVNSTLALRLSPPEEKGRWLGWLRTTDAVGHLLLMGIALALIRLMEYEGMFLLAGGLICCGAFLIGLAENRPRVARSPTKRERRFLLDRRYRVYYLLEFLQGARKQMFLMFSVWLLVRGHGVQREMILTLMMVNQVLSLVTAPAMGRLVDRFGERSLLSLSYIALTGIFVGYASIQRTEALYGLYVLDNLTFVGGIALNTYLHKIAPPEDLRPTLTMGVTMNHIPSVLVPLIGGLLWERFGSAAIFLGATVFPLLSLLTAQWVRPSQGESLLVSEPAD
jgi:predicted MFS family arabinose efflux permease